MNVSILFIKPVSTSIFIQSLHCLQYISVLTVGRHITETIVKIMMDEPAFIVLYFLLLSKCLSNPLRVKVISEIDSCDLTFTETSHFGVPLEDCTTSRPLTTTIYNTTAVFASDDPPSATSFESMITELKPGGPNCTLPNEYLRGPLSQGNDSISEDFIYTQEINFMFSVPIKGITVTNDQESSAYIEQFSYFFLIFVFF